uniref:hypothetical protein n=1 Tax=Clostridium sp. NkU-1 TaxID=1095009 RepID=UPI000B13B1EB
MEAEGEHLTATIDLYEGELKFFYPDYKNYYYLIYEDKAIHKSVAEYVDKEARTKATAKTCYTRRPAVIFPSFPPCGRHACKWNSRIKSLMFPMNRTSLRRAKSFTFTSVTCLIPCADNLEAFSTVSDTFRNAFGARLLFELYFK